MLKVNNLGAGGRMPVRMTATLVTDEGDTHAGKTTWTFSSTSLGSAEATRHIILLVSCDVPGAAGDGSVTGVTLGGTPMTELIQQPATEVPAADSLSAAFILKYPTGTGADIIVSTSVNFTDVGFSLYKLTGARVVELYASAKSQSTGDESQDVSVDTVDDGAVFLVGTSTSSSGTGSLTGVTEDVEGKPGGVANLTLTSGFDDEFSSDSPRPCSFDMSAGRTSGVCVSLRGFI